MTDDQTPAPQEPAAPAATPPSANQPPAIKPPSVGREDASGFFAALFDWEFEHFIAVKFARVIYIIVVVFLGLGLLGAILVGFATDAAAGLAALVFGPLVALLYLILIRLSLESLVASIRTAEEARNIRAHLTD